MKLSVGDKKVTCAEDDSLPATLNLHELYRQLCENKTNHVSYGYVGDMIMIVSHGKQKLEMVVSKWTWYEFLERYQIRGS